MRTKLEYLKIIQNYSKISKGRACFDYGDEVGNHLIKSKKNVNYIKINEQLT
jgi:hypothetical protein